jgi:hypothetical protein
MSYVKIGLLFISIVCIAWGGLITFSEKYFTYWQNAYWERKNSKQSSVWGKDLNRYGTGLGTFLFGVALTYFVIFQMQ